MSTVSIWQKKAEYLELRVLELQQLVEDLRSQLRDYDSGKVSLPFRLTTTEAALLRLLYERKLVTPQAIETELYSTRAGDPPDSESLIKVYIYKLRRKITRWGITIETVWGTGYRLARGSRERIDELSNKQAKAA